MNRIKIKLGFLILLAVTLFACDAQYEIDMTQWGDNATIYNVQVYYLKTTEDKMAEYYETGETTTSTQRVVCSDGTAVIDDENYTVTVTLKSGYDLTDKAFLIYHYGTDIEPLNDSPEAGIISDLSAGVFQYRVSSADGSEHDWTIYVNEQ
jgi:hypothetical protein